jgi:hypothetical protein
MVVGILSAEDSERNPRDHHGREIDDDVVVL